MVYCLDYSKTAHCSIWLSSRLYYLSKELHYFTEGLHYLNKVNLKGTLLDMNHITTLRIQSKHMNIIIWVSIQLQKSTFAASIDARILAV